MPGGRLALLLQAGEVRARWRRSPSLGTFEAAGCLSFRSIALLAPLLFRGHGYRPFARRHDFVVAELPGRSSFQTSKIPPGFAMSMTELAMLVVCIPVQGVRSLLENRHPGGQALR